MEWTTIVLAIIALIGTLFTGGGLYKYLLDRQKQDAVEKQNDDKQPIDQYGVIVLDLRSRISAVEESDRKCRDDHAVTREKLGVLQDRFEEQSEFVKQMKASQFTNAAEIVKLAKDVADAVVTRATLVAAAVAEKATSVATELVKQQSVSGVGLQNVIDQTHPLPVVVVGQPVKVAEVSDLKNIHE